MAFLAERLVLQYPVIDRDHEILYRLLAQFEAAVALGPHRRLKELFIALAAYIEAHFENEEHLMELHGYPERERNQHVRQHEEMRSNVSVLGTMVSSNYAHAAEDAVLLVQRWIDQHLDRMDRKFVSYLKCMEALPDKIPPALAGQGK